MKTGLFLLIPKFIGFKNIITPEQIASKVKKEFFISSWLNAVITTVSNKKIVKLVCNFFQGFALFNINSIINTLHLHCSLLHLIN